MTKNANSRKQKIIRVASYVLAALFVAAGATKLAGTESHVQHFTNWGFPLWFMYVVGATEVAGGLLLVKDKTRFIAAAMLASTMFGAVGTHIAAGEFAQTLPAFVLLIATSVLVYATRDQLVELISRVRRVTDN